MGALFLTAALLAASQNPAAPPPTSAPPPPARVTPRWIADWGRSGCMLAQEPNTPSPGRVAIEMTPGTGFFTLWLVDPAFGGRTGQTVEVGLRLEPGGRRIRGTFDRHVEGDRRSFGLSGIDTALLDMFEGTTELVVERAGAEPLTLPLANSRRAIAAMRECRDELLRAWGVDPAANSALRSPPRLLPSTPAISREAMAALPMGYGAGTAVLRLDVTADGRVAHCTPVVPSGRPSYDASSCRNLVERGRFVPATGADGTPVAASVIHLLQWASRIDPR